MKHFNLNYKNTPLCSDCSLTMAKRDIIFHAWFVQDAERNHSKLKTSTCIVSCSRQIFPTLSLVWSVKQACMVGILSFMQQMRELRNYDFPRVMQFANAYFLPGSQVHCYVHSDAIPTHTQLIHMCLHFYVFNAWQSQMNSLCYHSAVLCHFVFFVFYWSIVGLKCCVNFRSTAKLVLLNWQYVNIEDNIFFKKYNILLFQIIWFGIGTALDE